MIPTLKPTELTIQPTADIWGQVKQLDFQLYSPQVHYWGATCENEAAHCTFLSQSGTREIWPVCNFNFQLIPKAGGDLQHRLMDHLQVSKVLRRVSSASGESIITKLNFQGLSPPQKTQRPFRHRVSTCVQSYLHRRKPLS